MVTRSYTSFLRLEPIALATVLLCSLAVGYMVGLNRADDHSVGAQNQTAHSVVYLEVQPSSGDLTSQRLTTELGTQIVTTWQGVLNVYATSGIDILIIDPGSLSLVDWDWLKPRYRVGLIVVGINVHLATLGTMLDEPEFATEPHGAWTGEFYSFAHVSRNGTPVSLTAVHLDPSHQPTGNDWLNEYLSGDESSTGPSQYGNVEPGTTAYFFLNIRTELDQQDDLDALQQP